jgi:signal peptidase I
VHDERPPLETIGAVRRGLAVVLSLVLPGLGHIALGRHGRAAAWWVLNIAGLIIIVWIPIVALGGIAVTRIAAAIDAGRLRPPPGGVPRWETAAVACVAAVALFLAARTALRVGWAEVFRVPAAGMHPALAVGDLIVASKRGVDVGRGDVVVFEHPCEPRSTFVKRVVALAGDTVEVRCGTLYVNGRAATSAVEDRGCQYLDVDDPGQTELVRCVARDEELDGARYRVVLRDGSEHRDFPGDEPATCAGHDQGVAPWRVESAAEPPSDACAPSRWYVVPDAHVFAMGDNRDDSADSRYWGPVPVDAITGEVTSVLWATDPRGGVDWRRFGRSLR